MNYYLVVDRRREGPLQAHELAAHGLERDSLVWCAGLSDWTRADCVGSLREVIATIPPPLPAFLGAGEGIAELADPPATFRKLYRWWILLFALTFLLPLVGSLCLVMSATTEYRRIRTGGSSYYYGYSDIGIALNAIGGISIGLGVVALIAAVVFFAILLHKMWKVVQDGRARTTPDKAAGFLFIPFFNLYWVFVAVRGLALDLNSYVRRHRAGMDAEPAPTGLALVFCILLACTAVPYIGLLIFVPMAVVLSVLVTRLKNCVVAIVQVRQAVDADRQADLAAASEVAGQSLAIEPAERSPHFKSLVLQDQPLPPV